MLSVVSVGVVCRQAAGFACWMSAAAALVLLAARHRSWPRRRRRRRRRAGTDGHPEARRALRRLGRRADEAGAEGKQDRRELHAVLRLGSRRRRRSRLRLRRQVRREGAEQLEQVPVGRILRHRSLRAALRRCPAARRRNVDPDEHGAALPRIVGHARQCHQPLWHAGLREQVRAAVRPFQFPRPLQRAPVHGWRRHRSLHEPVARGAAGLGAHRAAVGRRRDVQRPQGRDAAW